MSVCSSAVRPSDDEQTPALPHMEPTASPSPRVPPGGRGAGARCQNRQRGEQLAERHARLGAQIVMTTRTGAHASHQLCALENVCVMRRVTCCALPFTHPLLFSIVYFLCETISPDS